MSNNKKILIITGSYGNGHISVTNSIVNQLNRMHLPNLTVIEHDLYQEAHPIINSIAKKYYINSYKYFRKSYRFFYYANQDNTEKCFYRYYGLNRLINLIMKEKPDLILLTFPTPVMSIIKKDIGVDIPVATVITDYTMHKNWYTPNSNRYFVATEHTKSQLVQYGVDPSIIDVTGIPIHERFNEEVDRNAWLTNNGLQPNKKTLLMVAGAFGVVGGFNEMLATLTEESDHQYVVVCGNNTQLINTLKAAYKDTPNVLIIGFTKEMAGWMASCDLMLTKPGGITISESLCKSIPLVFFNPAPGQESENAKYFTEKGFSRITNSYEETTATVLELLSNEHQLKQYKENMQKHYLPESSKNICMSLMQILESTNSQSIATSKAGLYARLFAK
ncbi:diglucosyl diacylglycerol synthase [Macrococcus armenti]|uniref:diglucosyl diacylglycerol synthase n=1 Tax=Macrococcus armenti TaxID=2875764 RepID=UPI001CCF5DC5|nr:diglucosyl diacylglycerol synthase [Macrococcus armenti]UBH16079.1 diglucosyl diacylglycerol synthase [Macrococcus armenti]UBH18439.1 diglucosyl diacylglycerol synthase [Macrococcus armenti]UBH20706.1 diglucosyl diacylglycerol synthase [Macrococcus armenti]